MTLLSILIQLLALSTFSVPSYANPAQFDPNLLIKNSPSLPLGVIRRLSHHSARSATSPPPPPSPQQHPFLPHSSLLGYKAHYFPQRVSHVNSDAVSNETFSQRYWFDAQFYREGGPVFFLDGGETDGEGRLEFLEKGILRVLAEATGGIGVVHEHRYYGTSHPFKNLSTSSLRYLTTNQSLLDSAHFASTIVFPGLEHLNLTAKDVPWIYYGGSYAGAKAALARKGWRDVWWGAIASSGVTKAVENYWEYFEPIRKSAPSACISHLQNHTSVIDSLLSLRNPLITSSLKSYFGLGDLTRIEDFVSTLMMPLGLWQGRNWDAKVSSGGLDGFCEALENTTAAATPYLEVLNFPGIPKVDFSSFSSYANYIKENVVSLCPPTETQDNCFSVDGYAGNEGLEEAPWRSWMWQVCTEWGYFMPAPPEGEEKKALISKFITMQFAKEICEKAFGDAVPKDGPEVWKINQFGGLELREKRLAFIDGSEDPWIYATPHSPHSKQRHRNSTLSEPFHVIPGGVHHWDENSLLPATNPLIPKSIREIHKLEVEWVESWLEEWRERGRWKIDPEPDPDNDGGR